METAKPQTEKNGEANEKLAALLEENLRLSREIYRLSKKTHNFLIWQSVFAVMKILLIVLPIIIGIIYLPPLIKGWLERYNQLLGVGESPLNLLVPGAETVKMPSLEDLKSFLPAGSLK
ncbi:hypothetical protein COX69_00655 [Candidatus Falkowbacteria bacterium CG_4_10_14_0_2_um_filter_48_10]|uniref:Uncharacterized protein n=1 Tax=Candidatus Falkowbacteria bacterium CG23_combo_of_CG06-09_8_20_14_all_49_15 TaxID=1974572 RepID=A0A2G9ZLL2_9BACT|nr:MAG: hypothetical protein COX22_00925 [Candidatus Falkowbacteria bacterium CG23_combo_of_CG06-09_8_20_14_all_49_15]PJA09111.1 MAG: hypothetical protein COX69_00655 [Candidatus Falkowbacteria bacterium CG_4_10_14_0_2_um_filter_48_10]